MIINDGRKNNYFKTRTVYDNGLRISRYSLNDSIDFWIRCLRSATDAVGRSFNTRLVFGLFDDTESGRKIFSKMKRVDENS